MVQTRTDTVAVVCFGVLPVVATVAEKGCVVVLALLALLGVVSVSYTHLTLPTKRIV